MPDASFKLFVFIRDFFRRFLRRDASRRERAAFLKRAVWRKLQKQTRLSLASSGTFLTSEDETFDLKLSNKSCSKTVKPNSSGTTIPKRLHLRVDFLNLGEERFYSENSELPCLWDSLSIFEVAENGNVSNINTLCKNDSTDGS